MNSNMMKWFGKAFALVAVALFAGNAWAAYKDFASDAMSAASGFSGGSVSGKALTVTDASKLAYVPGGSNDALNRKARGWYAGATIRWPEGGARDEDASMQTSRMTSSVSGTSDLSGTTLTRTTEHARMHTCMATTTWWGYITPEEAYAKKTGDFTTTLTMSGKNYGLTTYGVNPATFTVNFPVDGLVLKDDKGIQWYPVVALRGEKVYGDLNVALKDGGEVVSVADAAITNAITLEAGVTFRKNGKAVTGLDKLTLLGGSYDFDPKAAGCTLGAGCIAQYNESTLLYDVIPCPHEWEYSINKAGDTFTATCKKGCGYTPQILTISLSATSKTYDGTEISASLTYNKSEAEFKEQTGATVGAIVYSGDRKSAGEQKASVTITVVGGTEYTISKTLTIAPAQLSTATVTMQSATMNFADKELTNAVSSVTAPGISTDDWEVVDPTALYQVGSGYSNCTYTVTLKGKNNFDGTTTATWTILAPTVTFAADAMGRGDYESGGKLYNDNYGEAVGRELVVTASPNIIFVNGHWFVGATVDVPNDVRVFAPSDSQLTPDENLRVTVSTTGKTYTGTQIFGGQVTDTIFQVLDDDHDSAWWAGLGTFQYFKKIRWFTEISPAMVEQAKLAGKDELTFTLTVGGITGRWEGLKYTDFVIKAPLDGFVFKVGRNEFNTADIGNVAFSTNTPSIQLIADSVVTNACAIDYKTKKRVFTDVANYSVFETKVSDSCWVYSCEHSIVTITVPNVANQASKVVKVGDTVKVAIDKAETQYEVRYGDTVTIDYTAAAGYIPPTDTKTMTNVKDGDALTDLPVFVWPTFTFDPAAPANTTAAVSTNGVELTGTAPYVINSNDTVHVVYKADEGCYFADGTTEKTIDDMKITADTVVPAEKVPAQAWPAHVCDGVTFTKRITDTATLQALFTNGGNGYFATNVMLTGDAVADKAFTGTINFCLNGYVLDANGHFVNLCGGEATVYDCGTTTNYFTFAANGLWELTDDIENADTNLLGGVVTGGGRNPADPEYPVLYVGGNAISLTIKGGNFVGNQSTKWGGVVDNYGSKLVIDGGTFAGNRCATYGGVVYACDGEVEINGGAFVSNRCDYSGGVIYAYDNDVTVMDGTFIGNYAEYGGVIELDCYDGERAVSLAVEDGLFMGNSAKSGGVVYGYAGKEGLAVEVDIGGGCFEDNQADYGGVYYAYGDNCILTAGGDAMFVGNKVTVDGNCGGAFYNGGKMTLQDNVVISNTLAGWGTIYNSGTLTVTGDVQVVDNVANYGGAIYTYHSSKKPGGVCNVYGGLFKGNAAFNGGACWSSLGACVTVGGDAMFVGNTGMGEDNCGGAFYNGGRMTLQDNVVISNTLAGWGTIYNYGTLTVTGDVQVVDNVATNNGSVVFNNGWYSESGYPGECYVYGGTFTGNRIHTAFVNSGGTFEIGGKPVIKDNGYEDEEDGFAEYDFVANARTPFALSETVPYAADQVVTIGSFAADGTNDFITVLTNAKATDADRFVSSVPEYETWFDANDDTLKLVLPVAQIVTNGVTNLFAKLDAAIEAAKTNDTVTLLKACKSDGEAIDLPLTLDRNGFAVTNLTLGAGAVLALANETESPNKLRGENKEMFGEIADRAQVVTDKTYTFIGALDLFVGAEDEAVATTYGEGGVEYLESYATFSNALEVVATNGTVYALKKEIFTPGFAIRRNMTIDLETVNPTGTNTLTITSAYADKKTSGILVTKGTTNVWFKGGAVKVAAGSGVCTLVESMACKMTIDCAVFDGTNLDAAKTPSVFLVREGGLDLAGPVGKVLDMVIGPEDGYALNVNCYGNSTGITVRCQTRHEKIRICGNVLLNVPIDAPVQVLFNKSPILGNMDVNAFNAKTFVTKWYHETKDPDPALNKPEYSWVVTKSTPVIDPRHMLVFGVAQVVGAGAGYYPTFKEAVEAAASGDTIILLNDAKSPMSYEIKKTFTLDLNGHTLAQEKGLVTLWVKDGAVVTVYGTNENSRVSGNLQVESTVTLRGGRYDLVNCLGTVVLDGVEMLRTESNKSCLMTDSKSRLLTVLNSRVVSSGRVVTFNGGGLVVSNTIIQATETGRAISVAGGKEGSFVKLLEGTQLLSTEGTDQLYWNTNYAAQVSITKKDGIDCLAQEGFGWTTNGVEEGFWKLVPSTTTYDVMPLMFTKNLFNLAPAMKLNPAGQLTLDSDASVEVAGETVEVKPDDITIDVGDTADVITVKSIPDLTYELLAKESLLGEWTVVETKVATGAETAFTAKKDGAAAKFYTVRVRY